MIRTRSLFLASCTAAAIALAAAPQSRAANDFYKGKTVTIVVGFSAGGGYDVNARALSRHIAKHIPGKPTVIVQNMPGAGSLTAVRYLDATAARDGTVITTFNPGNITLSIVTPEKVRGVDFRNFSWIGAITPDFRVCYGYDNHGPKTWADLMKRTAKNPFILGSTAKGSGNYVNGAELREIFGAHVKQILGFPGSAEQRLAIERGELEGDCGSYSSIPQNWIDSGKVHAFVRFTDKVPPEIPASAKYIGTFAKTKEQKQLLNLLNAADEVGRPFIMSKKVPADRVAIMRTAFNETMKDPAFLAEMKKEQLPVNPETGVEAEKIVAGIMDASPSLAAKAKKIYE